MDDSGGLGSLLNNYNSQPEMLGEEDAHPREEGNLCSGSVAGGLTARSAASPAISGSLRGSGGAGLRGEPLIICHVDTGVRLPHGRQRNLALSWSQF